MPLSLGEALARAQTFPARFQAFSRTAQAIQTAVDFVLRVSSILLAVFLIHQLLFWATKDPERSFNFAALVLDLVEIVWDLTGILYNAVADILNAAVIPLWNGATYYIIEPAVTLILEVFSLIFLRKQYTGFIAAKDFPYGGFVCDPTSVASSTWCGRFNAYSERLEQGDSLSKQNSITFGTQTARRLQELAGEADFDVPTVESDAIVGALDGLATQAIVMGASVLDVLFAVGYDVLSTTAVFLFDAAYTVFKILFNILKQIVKSGMLQTIIGIGVDFILIMVLEVYVPYLIALIDAVVCAIQLLSWSGWDEQLECAEKKCFQGPDAAADLWMFTSVPQVMERFGSILEATLNSRTGRKFTGGATVDFGVSKLDEVFPSLSAGGCTSCFSCKFPELRALWYITAISVSLVKPENFNAFYGNVTDKCLTNGSYYTTSLCGPRGAEELPFRRWRSLYREGHAEFDLDIVQSYAGLMMQRAVQMGGASAGEDAAMAQETAEAWFLRNPTLPETEQAAQFTYLMCKAWRKSDAGQLEVDAPQHADDFAPGSIAHITSAWAFESCKRFKFHVYGDVSRAIHNLGLEVAMCLEDKVECKKDFELCVGGCSGDLTSTLKYDFSTMIATSELNPDVLGEDGFHAANADCNVRQGVIEVELFEGGDSFKTFAVRMQTRSGMTALDNDWCENNPLSCGIIQRALEKSPGLRFVDGEFRHTYDATAPSPPPPPSPPAATLLYGKMPPSPPPPPKPPPPYYDLAEPCVPIPTPEFFGIDLEDIHRENAQGTTVGYRAACVFAKRIVEKRRRVKSCFSSVINPSPPPPPPAGGIASAQAAVELEEDRRINGEDSVYGEEPPDGAQQLANELRVSVDETEALIQRLGDNQPVLREFLTQAIGEMQNSITRVSDGSTKASDYYGRRLMQRDLDYDSFMERAIVDHPIMTTYGRQGLPGVTRGDCQALCEGVTFDTNNTDATQCRALAFKRADPRSLTDFTGRCYLLTGSGACKVEDFASQLYTRHIPSEEICHDGFVSDYDNPLCVELPTTRTDTRVLTHADALAIVAQTPNPSAPGSGGLPMARTTLEAGFFVALARREGIFSFWAASPDTQDGEVVLHWVTEGGGELVFRQGERRCVLISSKTSDTSTKMYASLEPCSAKLADGVLTVAASAAPPPPPGAIQTHVWDGLRAPPPPPSIRSRAISIYKREKLYDYTQAVCSGRIGEGEIHRNLCSKFLEEVGQWQTIYGVGLVAPICNSICWHSCNGVHVGGQDDDSFLNCRQVECAAYSCYDFLKRECDPVQHGEIDRAFNSLCTITPPSPPSPPALP